MSKVKKIKVSKRKEKNGLTLEMKKFCIFYVTNDVLFQNGTLCYAAAYGFDLESLSDEPVLISREPYKTGRSLRAKAENVCAVNAGYLLRTTKIQDYINQLFREHLTDESIDNELSKVMHQNDDMPSKMAAIREANKLKSRITDKVDVTTAGEKVQTFDENQIERLASRLVNDRQPLKK